MQKTILITGSTDGIGKLAAIRLAEEGHIIYVHGRNTEKLAAVISEIKAIAQTENVSGFTAAFSPFSIILVYLGIFQPSLAYVQFQLQY